jgi:ABC-type polysaccharide/polyol phosphate transport system ATPase subunit
MSDLIVKAVDLSKTYRLYAKPHHRFLDMFGLLRNNKGAYTEHRALDLVNLEIRRGEKVAFIGRNGAGKSTLLKLIAGVAQPTSGSLEVSQGAHALLQIGSGFHPDFTGRQNALSYLAHLGVTGDEAPEKLENIVDFSELEEYIDQPIKTYSTGMVARLMFATSTVIEPELLILDEILGVGDAYFSNKSFERIREMCAGGRTTVLLVSHDIYSAQKLSDRMLWVDQGRILLDDVPEVVVRGYEDSIRLQEESRLRKKVLMSMQKRHEAGQSIYLELRTSNGRPLKSPICFTRIALLDGEHELAALSWDSPVRNAEAISEGTAWGKEGQVSGIKGRWMMAHGIFHKISLRFDAPYLQALQEKRLAIKISAASEEPATLTGEILANSLRYETDPLTIPAKTHDTKHLIIHSTSAGTGSDGRVNTTGHQGSGAVTLVDARLLDDQNRESFWLRHGRPASFLLDYRVIDPELSDYCDICLVFFRAGTRENICRIVTRDLKIDARHPQGTIRLDMKRLPLGAGKYAVWVFVAKHGYLMQQQTQFYSLNPDVYLSQPDILEFEVTGELIASNTAFVGEGDWSQSPYETNMNGNS